MTEPANPYLRGLDGPEAFIPGRIARLIERAFPDINKLRAMQLGHDMEAYQALDALHRAGLAWRVSATGNEQEPEPEIASSSNWLSTTQAAAKLGITDRAVRIACTTKRIPAEKYNGNWRIARTDLANYRQAHPTR